MSHIPPPEQPGMYADAHGAWWWWDGAAWTPAPAWGPVATSTSTRQDEERNKAVLMWVLYLVLGGWVAALIFYLVSKEKPFVRHHSAEALNLTLVLLVPQVLGLVLMIPAYIDWFSSSIDDPSAGLGLSAPFLLGLALNGAASVINLALAVTAAVRAHRGEWWRLPIGLHPVRGVRAKGQAADDLGG